VLLVPSRVNPTVLDVKGRPVPGLSGVGRPAPPRGDFAGVLRQLQRGASASTTGPAEAPSAFGPARTSAVGPLAFTRRPALRAPRTPAPPFLGSVRSRPFAAAARRPPATASTQGRPALVAAIERAAATAGVEPALSVAIARAESNLDPRARSADGLSVGTFQVTWYTAAEMRRKIAAGTVARPPGADDVALGVGYLRYLHDLFERDAQLTSRLETVAVDDADERRLFAVAAFNAGEGRVAGAQARAAAAGGDPTRFADVRPYLPPVTQTYVGRVMTYRDEELPPSTPA
jgi:soluble lytic murein transglycosylase-like protein